MSPSLNECVRFQLSSTEHEIIIENWFLNDVTGEIDTLCDSLELSRLTWVDNTFHFAINRYSFDEQENA